MQRAQVQSRLQRPLTPSENATTPVPQIQINDLQLQHPEAWWVEPIIPGDPGGLFTSLNPKSAVEWLGVRTGKRATRLNLRGSAASTWVPFLMGSYEHDEHRLACPMKLYRYVSKMYPRCIQATNISGSVLWCMVSKVVCPWECPTPRTPSVTLGAQANRACLWRGWSLDEWAPAFEKPPADAISPIGALKTEARNAENWLLLQIFKLCQIKWVKRRRQHTFQLTTQMPAQNTSWNTTWNTVSLDPTKQPTPWRLPRLCNPRLVNVEVVFDQAFRLQGSTGAK